jgi:hypothetical protein
MSQQIVIDIVAQTDKLTAEINKSTSKIQGLTKAFVGIGVAAKGFSTASGFINKTTDAASDLEETMSKTSVLFGKNSKEVVAFSKNAAKSFGQSKQQALDAASTFATFGKAAGVAGKDLVEFSTDFVALASDLASFNNTSPEQAINAIGSALRGEAEPLRAYGVLLNDAALRQAALELGLISTTKNALTPQQKVLAAQKVIYEQTTAAQGDFARTSDGLANSTRILEAEQANLNANIGQTFLPIMKQVNSIMMVAVEAFTSLPDPVQKIAVALGLVVAVGGPLVVLLGSIKTAMVALQISTISLTTVMSALPFVAVGLAIVLLITQFDDISNAAKKLWEAVSKWWSKIYDDIKEFAGKAIDWLKDNWPKILAVLTGPFGLFAAFIITHKDEIIQAFKDLWDTVKTVVSDKIELIVKTAKEWWNGLKEWFANLFADKADSLLGVIKGGWNAIKDFLVTIFEIIFINSIKWWLDIALKIVEYVTQIKTGVVDKFNELKDATIASFKKLQSAASEIWNLIKNYITGAVDNIKDKFGEVYGKMVEVGKDIARGIGAGLTSMTGWFRSLLGNWIQSNIPDWAKTILKIQSPSKVFAGIGTDLVQGLAQGITGSQRITTPTRLNTIAPMSAPFNITINAGLGTDPYTLGREITTVLQKYGRISVRPI